MCTPGGQAYECSFGPDHIGDALAAQAAVEHFRNRNNELVLDTRSVVHSLPYSIDGFFYLSSTEPDGAAYMHDVQQRFKAAYHLSDEHTPPLVRLNFAGQGGGIVGDRPFSLVA